MFVKNKIPAFGVVSKTPNWFPAVSMRDAASVIRDTAKQFGYEDLISYGHSMGGYASIKYSSLLQTSKSLCFCPQYSIEPEDTGSFDYRYVKDYNSALHRGMKIGRNDVSGTLYVFFDPYMMADARHVEMIQRVANIIPIKVPFTEHKTLSVLVQVGAVQHIIVSLAKGHDLPLKDLYQIYRVKRRNISSYWEARTLMLAARKPLWINARRHAIQRLAEMQQDGANTWIFWAKFYSDQGDLANTAAWLSKFMSEAQMNVPYHVQFDAWRLSRRLSEPFLRKTLFRRLLAQLPRAPWLLQTISQDLFSKPAVPPSLAEIQAFEKHIGENHALRRAVVAGYCMVGEIEIAAERAQSLAFEMPAIRDDGKSFVLSLRRGHGAEKYLLAGWSVPEDGGTWAINTDSLIAIPIGRCPPCDFDFFMWVFANLHPTQDRQRFDVHVNGILIQQFEVISKTVSRLQVTLPASLLKDCKLLIVRLHHPDAFRPCDVSGENDNRALAIAVREVALAPKEPFANAQRESRSSEQRPPALASEIE